MRLNVITLAIVILAVIFFVTHAMNLPWTALRIAGLAIALPAFILFSTARMQLGRSFSVEAKATELVTTGIYSRIRNPIYFFGALMILGVIVWTGRPILLLIYVILIPAQIVRARKEAQILEAKFGDAYVEYRKKTWF
ncbi:MAG TPA: isoprenylcysteine carboxylmethyltransferase family protein [Terracidiphilus sp.]|nr:isoprenylcysteine carboxylmethyltransferase family protein [Terracidiphilus sp.]